MSAASKPRIYREMIDELVDMCRNGQGQIGARRARAGVWNANVRDDFLEDQHAANVLLSRLAPGEREVVARPLAAAVVTGVFETSRVLEHRTGPALASASRPRDTRSA